MNTGKLHMLALALLEDHHETQVTSKLQDLATYLENLVNSPADATPQQGVSETLASIRESLQNAPSKKFDEDWIDMMHEMGLEHKYGDALLEEINNIFSENKITPSLALERINKLHASLTTNETSLTNIQRAFEHFGLAEQDSLTEGECEISIMLPRDYFKNNLEQFGKELKQLSDSVLRPFVEVTGSTSKKFTIKSISSSEPVIYLEAIPIVAVSIILAVHYTVLICKNLQDIKIRRKELENLEVGEKALAALDRDIDSKIEKLVAQHVEEYLKKMREMRGKDNMNINASGRSDDEARHQVASSMKKLLMRIDAGFSIKIRGKSHQTTTTTDEEGNTTEEKLTDNQKNENKLISEIQRIEHEKIQLNKDGPYFPELLEHDDKEHEDEHT